MKLPAASVRRPVFTSMVTLILIVLGGASLVRLRIDLLPSVELPTASVRTEYEGASPEVMERQVTQIVEEIVATVPGVQEITSVTEEGRSRVNVTFVWGTELDAAVMDLRATIEDELNELPEEIVRPSINKFSIDTFPVVLVGISSPLDPVALTELIENRIRHRFTRIPGVAQVDFWGGFPREVRIEILPEKIVALGLSLNEIIDAIRKANLDLPAGRIEQGRYEVALRAPAHFESIDDIEQTVIAMREGAPVTVGDVAQLHDTYEKLSRIIRVNGKRGIRIAIRKQAGANTVEVSRRILAEIDSINSDFPQLHVVPVINQGNFIERSINNVARSVLYGGGLAILVLLYFLRSIRSTLIISFAIPISIISTFSLIYFAGLTINLMTLGGLALGVGMMVDSSIVVLENIYRIRKEEGPGADVSIKGATEVGPAIIASTITTLVIFLPIIFVEGISGILFRELAYVIAFALGCSLLLSLTLIPMLSDRFLSVQLQNTSGRHTKLKKRTEASFARFTHGYLTALRFTLDHRFGAAVVVGTIFVGTGLMARSIGTEFLPPSDEGEVRIRGEMEVGTRLELVDQQTRIMERIAYPAVPEAVSSVAQVRDNVGEIRMSLVPATERVRSNTEIAQDLRKRLENQIPGMEIRVRAPQGQFLLDRLLGGTESITVEIRGYNLKTLQILLKKVVAAIKGLHGITDVDQSYEANIPEQEIRVDRAKIASLGLTPADVTRVIETAFAGSKAGNYRSEGNSYRILVQLKDAHKRSIDELLNITLRTPTGQTVALRNVVTTAAGRAPQEITRKDQQRVVTVNANISERDMGSVAREIEARLQQIPKPDNYELRVTGNFEKQQESFQQLLLALGLSLLLVFMVLAAQYESFRDPLVVMVSTPMAAIGVVGILLLTDTTMNLQSGIGCVMLGGIVVNNAILLVDQASRLRAEGVSVRTAIELAGQRRLRPILMTTLTTILGLTPLALGFGEGADAQAPLARVVVGGLIGATLITLFFIPVVYSLMYRDGKEVSP